MRWLVCLCVVLTLSACTSVQVDSEQPKKVAQGKKVEAEQYNPSAEVREISYNGEGGISPDSKKFHISLQQPMYTRNRAGSRTSYGPASLENVFLPWVASNGEGMIRLRRLELVSVSRAGERKVLYSQTWKNEEIIAGGQWLNTRGTWFAKALEMGRNLPVFKRDRGDVILDTTGRPNEVHHVWLSTWPHPKIPAGTWKVGFVAEFGIYGEALIHFGLDRYSHDNVTTPINSGPKQNVWQIISTPTFSKEQTKDKMHVIEYLTEVKLP